MFLYNRINKKELRKKIATEPFKRLTLTFYRYIHIAHPFKLRDELYADWLRMNVLGRIYMAHEGINAQLSVPEHFIMEFIYRLYKNPLFTNVPVKQAIEDSNHSFFALAVKVKKKLVADGLKDDSFDAGNTGERLDALSFHRLTGKQGTITVDMRNRHESEVGHFKDALCPDVRTFREALPVALHELKEKKNEKILLYCTGGIRCEKASAYLRHHGFKEVYQLDGGIIQYASEIKRHGLKSKFIGKNFVFDERMGERITEEIISRCYHCGEPSDRQVNCAYQPCHTLIIQCEKCMESLQGCCSEKCALRNTKYPILNTQ